jgi:hypothetical protein
MHAYMHAEAQPESQRERERERDAAEQERELAICSVPASSRDRICNQEPPPTRTAHWFAYKSLIIKLLNLRKIKYIFFQIFHSIYLQVYYINT